MVNMDKDAYYGTLERLENKSGSYGEPYKYVWKIVGPQPAMMASRIIPGCWSHQSGSVEIPDNMCNVEHIDWLMLRYPLKIVGNGWDSRLEELRILKAKRKLIKNLKVPSVGARFKGTLYDFQKMGVDFLLKTSGNALLADEMGLGKTIEALAYLVSDNDTFPCLVVAPLVTLQNWNREIKRFLDCDKTIIIRSGKSNVQGLQWRDFDFYIINYDLVWKRRDDLQQLGIKTIICDEVQNLRHLGSGKTQAVKELAMNPDVKHRLALSGTPCYNHGIEIWSIIDFVFPGLLGTFAEFSKEFINSWDYHSSVFAEKREALYKILTENVMLRRRKVEVLKDLPEKTRYKQQIEIDKAYYAREMAIHMNAFKEQLRAAAIEPKTQFQAAKTNMAYTSFANNERVTAGVSKVPFVVEFVESMMETEEPVVVYCHHLVVHSLLHERLSKYRPVSIIGGQTDMQRQYAIDSFQDKRSLLMIAGIRAGNLGINLTSANYVIFAELDWSPAVHRQAEDRLHRIGQQNPVFAYYLEGKGTYDEHISEILVDKKLEIDELLGDANKTDDYAAETTLNEKAKELVNTLEKKFSILASAEATK